MYTLTVKYTLTVNGPQYPVPPTDLSAPYGASVAFTIICSIFFAVMVVFALRQAFRKDGLLLACVLGGLLAGFLEPMLDLLGNLWFAADNYAIAVETWGRHIPLYVVMGYAFFFGAQAYIVYRCILAGKSTRFFIGAYAASWMFDCALQVTGAQMGLYQYYGDHPTLIFGAPAWWFSIDAGFDLVAGLVLYSVRDRLKGWGFLLAIPIIPMVYAAMNGASGWPVFTALNSNYDPSRNANGSELFLWAGGLGTMALAFFAAWMSLRVIARIVAANSSSPADESASTGEQALVGA